MTSTTSGRAGLEHAVIREILHTLAEREMTGRSVQLTFRAVPKEKTGNQADNQEGWLEFVVREVAALPWHESNLPDGRTPPQPRAAVGLISLLATALERDTITPSSVNTTWAGGVAVEWHIGGIDLEIACQPDGTAEFNFEDQLGEEQEGTVTADTTEIRKFIGRLPTSRQQAA